MLLACRTPPLPLLTASIELVAVVTQPGEGGAAPPVGVVELALRLWRATLSACRPPVGAELAPGLLELASRLPSLVDLADELLRPSMQLLDWFVLQVSDTACTRLTPWRERVKL
mgnify:CR=1 FL=1|jgi:hypothetical protein